MILCKDPSLSTCEKTCCAGEASTYSLKIIVCRPAAGCKYLQQPDIAVRVLLKEIDRRLAFDNGQYPVRKQAMPDWLKILTTDTDGLTGVHPVSYGICICIHINCHGFDLPKTLPGSICFFTQGSGGKSTMCGTIPGFLGSFGFFAGISSRRGAGQSGAADLRRLKISEIRAMDESGNSLNPTALPAAVGTVFKNPFHSPGEGQSLKFLLFNVLCRSCAAWGYCMLRLLNIELIPFPELFFSSS
jgi:hypothetical protein